MEFTTNYYPEVTTETVSDVYVSVDDENMLATIIDKFVMHSDEPQRKVKSLKNMNNAEIWDALTIASRVGKMFEQEGYTVGLMLGKKK